LNCSPSDVFVHPTALVESDQIGAGSCIWAFSHVCHGAVIGKDCKLGDHTYVEAGAVLGNKVTLKNQVAVWDGVRLEDGVFVGPNVTFTNVTTPRARRKKDPSEYLKTVVREGATLGAGSVLLCGIEIGRHAFVGAGAVVTKSIQDHQLVMGNPGKPDGWVCECGERLPEELRCTCGLSYKVDTSGLVRNIRIK